MEPLNKGHFGTNINSAVLSLVERLRGFSMYNLYREVNLGTKAASFIERYLIHCPLLGVSSFGGSTVQTMLLFFQLSS